MDDVVAAEEVVVDVELATVEGDVAVVAVFGALVVDPAVEWCEEPQPASTRPANKKAAPNALDSGREG